MWLARKIGDDEDEDEDEDGSRFKVQGEILGEVLYLA